MIKAGIIGATGYAGQQLASLLVNHPEAEIKFVSSVFRHLSAVLQDTRHAAPQHRGSKGCHE